MLYKGRGNGFFENPRSNRKHNHHGELNDGDLLKQLSNSNKNSRIVDKDLDKLNDYYKGEVICKAYKNPKENIKELIKWVIGRGCLDDKTHALIIELVNEINAAFELENKKETVEIMSIMGMSGGVSWDATLKEVETLLDKIAPKGSYLMKDSGVYKYA